MMRKLSKNRLGLVTMVLLLAATGLADQGIHQEPVLATKSYGAYLPVVRRAYPPFPEQPLLLPIDNADGDGNYTVLWNAAARADSYELEEQWESGSWFRAYSGSATQIELKNRPPGSYLYRCRSRNSLGYSQWSNLQAANVQGNPPSEVSIPPSSRTSAGGKSVVKVVNDCPYVLRLDFTGPGPTVMELPKCDVCKVYSFIGPIFCPTESRPSQEIRLTAGEYRVFVTVDDPDIQPYIGHWDLDGNYRYSMCFYVVTTWTSKPDSTRQVVIHSCR